MAEWFNCLLFLAPIWSGAREHPLAMQVYVAWGDTEVQRSNLRLASSAPRSHLDCEKKKNKQVIDGI